MPENLLMQQGNVGFLQYAFDLKMIVCKKRLIDGYSEVIRVKKLSLNDYSEIKAWMYRNARPIELALWQYYFENGSKDAVLSALAWYQNDDGGFGHALEADSWNPHSSPYTTLRAVNMLKGIGFNDTKHPIIEGVFKFLESNAYCSEDGWFFSIPSNDDYPHAPWWTYSQEENAFEGIGVTAGLISFIFLNADRESELFRKAMSLAHIIIDKLKTNDKFGEMGIGGYCVLLDAITQAGLTSHFDCSYLAEVTRKLVRESIERDTSKWAYYTRRPSDYITSPDSIYYKDNADIVEKELDYLIDTRLQKGVWNITWSWFDNNEKYAKEFAISENWWKASVAIDKLIFLKNFGRLEVPEQK